MREQDYQGYWHYLLDFRNGFGESPIDNYRSHYVLPHHNKVQGLKVREFTKFKG